MIGRLKPATAREVLETAVDVEKVIREIFAKGSLSLKQRTLADLWYRAYGRPAQSLVAGGMVRAHRGWRAYANWTDEELAWAEKLSKKLLPEARMARKIK